MNQRKVDLLNNILTELIYRILNRYINTEYNISNAKVNYQKICKYRINYFLTSMLCRLYTQLFIIQLTSYTHID